MPFKDLREFIARLEKEGEAQRIEEEVDWDLEAGAMLRRCHELGLPAPFFQKVKGYPKGYRLFGGPLSRFRRIAIAMDMPPDTPLRELMEEYLQRKRQSVKPVLLNDGPCRENVHVGDEVDLLEFPVPVLHGGDGGRYIGTFHLTITKDLDSEWVNWGMYRLMVHNKNTLGIMAGPHTHLGAMYSQGYEPRNKPMEVAITIGVEPISTFCAASGLPYGVSEVDVAGGIRGEPIELQRCETIGLAVPATAEVVIEGEIRPYERMDEGPFGEFTGYMSSAKNPRPVIHVKAVTHRNSPILTMSCVGVPVDDNAIISLTQGADCLETLRARGLPVTGVCVFPETCHLLAVVAVKPPYPRVAEDIAHVVWGSRMGHSTPYIMVVEDDVDPFNMAQVLHALVTKCHPGRGIIKLENSPVSRIVSYLNQQERQNRLGAKVYFDCTWPFEWDPSEVPSRVSFRDAYPVEIQQKALAKWHKYGY